MDLPKLTMLLAKSELHFCQLGNLEDKHEGTIPLATQQAVLEDLKKQIGEKYDLGKIASFELTTNLMRATLYVSCWCLQQHESAAHWRIYGGQTGVAIKTRYSKLVDAFDSRVMIGMVTYVDPEDPNFPIRNSIMPAMHKRHFFHHEQECRLVVWDIDPIKASNNDRMLRLEYLDKCPRSLTLPLSVVGTLEEVVISPTAPEWFHECVRLIVEQFAPQLAVSHSKM